MYVATGVALIRRRGLTAYLMAMAVIYSRSRGVRMDMAWYASVSDDLDGMVMRFSVFLSQSRFPPSLAVYLYNMQGRVYWRR